MACLFSGLIRVDLTSILKGAPLTVGNSPPCRIFLGLETNLLRPLSQKFLSNKSFCPTLKSVREIKVSSSQLEPPNEILPWFLKKLTKSLVAIYSESNYPNTRLIKMARMLLWSLIVTLPEHKSASYSDKNLKRKTSPPLLDKCVWIQLAIKKMVGLTK